MADNAGDNQPSALEGFSKRLERSRKQLIGEEPEKSGSAWGRAMRVSSDLLAGVLVGTLLGVGLDRWLDSGPWFTIIGVGFGFAAGLRNMSRTLKD